MLPIAGTSCKKVLKSNSQPNNMSYDDILPKIGGFGRHQWKLYFLFAFPVFINVFFKIGNVLIVAAPPYRFALNSFISH